MWAHGLSVDRIAEHLGRTRDMVKGMRRSMGLAEREFPFFIKIIRRHGITREFYFKLPLRPGLEKLLKRIDRLVEWVDEGRDNYELARAFHVPHADVAYAIRRLGLAKPCEDAASEETFQKRCSACRAIVLLPRLRFRCDPCLSASHGDDPELTVGGFSEYSAF